MSKRTYTQASSNPNVKVIEASIPDPASATNTNPSSAPPSKLRVCAYCRVSSDSPEQETSYEAQVTHYTNYINANAEWELVGIFADEGISGTQAKKRPEFNRMIETCENGEVDMVITKSISRFARNTLDCLNYIRRLKALGIPIVFEKESINTLDPSGEMLITILASVAQQESKSISDNVRMGIEFGFQVGRGRLNYTTFLGYTGAGEPGKLVIVPEEARLVRRIYREYLEGRSPNSIANRMMEDGIPAPAGGRTWYASTVASILGNEKYCGDLLMQKYFTEDYLTHKVVRNTGQRPRYFVEDSHEPIVPKEVFFQVQRERERRGRLKNDPSKIRFGSQSALFGRLVCGKCGRVLKRYVRPDDRLIDWRCRERAMCKKSNFKEQPGARCDCRIVFEQEAKEAVVAAFNALSACCDELRTWQECLSGGAIIRVDESILHETVLAEQVEYTESVECPRCADHAEQVEQAERAGDADRADRAADAERANLAVQVRILLELIDEMSARAESERGRSLVACEDKSAACYCYEDFFGRTRYEVPCGVLDACGQMVRFDDGVVTRYVRMVTVFDWGYEVSFKAGVRARIELGKMVKFKFDSHFARVRAIGEARCVTRWTRN